MRRRSWSRTIMRALLVASAQAGQAGAGKTALAAAIAQRLAYDGRRVLAVRLGGSGDPGAVADAAFFATLPGARGRGGQPVPAVSAAAELPAQAGDSVLVVEAGEGDDPVALASALDAAVVLVQRGV